jgi:hypothetical protein
MLIHSIVPYETIFGNSEDKDTELKEIKGGYVVLSKADEKKQIIRVISTDPRMYLNNKYKIGEPFKD